MKILHSADWHLGAYVGQQCDDPMKRMENTMLCLNKLVETATEEKPDLILIAGDIFHTAKVWSDRANVELRTAALYISCLNNIAPTVVLYGTPNHDNFEQFCTLQRLTDAIFISQPEMTLVQTLAGPVQVAGLPGFDKGYFRAQHPGLSAEDENLVFSGQLDNILRGLSAQLDKNIPSVLMAHHTVVGCELDNGQHVFQQNDVLLSTATIDSTNFDMVCLGHIHKAQRIQCFKDVYYAGSPDAFTFNDEDHDKGFWIHEMIKDIDAAETHRFIWTPAREFMTCTWSSEAVNAYIESGIEAFGKFEQIQNKVVRVLYTCDKATEKALDKKKLERDLYAAGAYYVSEIRPEKVTAEVNKEKLHEKLTVRECLKNYLIEKIKDNTIDATLTEAEPIISEIEASSPAGAQTGMFLPLGIEVRNYRSYAEEKLSFEDLFFCMVNGKNGSGKSSLVMDAIVDCLYEEPREGELTGWIKSDTKSGSIIFTFRLGADTYRVTRTRQRSGKATLAFAKLPCLGQGMEYNKDFDLNWEDISCQKKEDTQQKIVQHLGMDADTFRSCVLIMQDQYGRFMEAKSENRMSVLANLLGLGIYEDLEEKTKKILTDVNRELKQVKDEAASIEQEVSNLEAYQSMKKDTEEKLESEQNNLAYLKKEHAATTEKVTLLNTNKAKLSEIKLEITKKDSAFDNTFKKLNELDSNISDTKEFLKNEATYTEKRNELLQVKTQIAGMDSTVSLMNDKKAALAKLKIEQSLATEKLKKYRLESGEILGRLENAKDLESELASLATAESELKLQEEKRAALNDIEQQILLVSKSIESINNNIRINEKQAAILKDSNCISIENAQCGFLKNAKEAASQLVEWNNKKAGELSELQKLENKKSALNYSSSLHVEFETKASRVKFLRIQMSVIEGEKKSRELYLKQISELEMTLSKLETEEKELTEKITELTPQINNLSELKTKVAELEKYEGMYQDIAKAKAYIEAVEPQIKELKEASLALDDERQELIQKQISLQSEIDNNKTYEELLIVFTNQIQASELKISEYNRSLGSLEEKIRILVEKAAELGNKQENIKLLTAKASQLQLLAEAFSQDGIPHQIVRDIVPDLEESANTILAQMTGGRMQLEFRTERTLKNNKDKEIPVLDVMITDIDNGELPYLSRSGGQKTRCSLSVIFALAILKASRMGLQLGMLFIDEPAGLDEEGIDGYCSALETIHNLYPEMRIVAISHDERMKARFSQHLFVEVTENGSKIRKG